MGVRKRLYLEGVRGVKSWVLWVGEKKVVHGGCEIMGVIPGGCDGSEIFAHSFDDSFSEENESEGDADAAIKQHPNRGFALHPNVAVFVNGPNG